MNCNTCFFQIRWYSIQCVYKSLSFDFYYDVYLAQPIFISYNTSGKLPLYV